MFLNNENRELSELIIKETLINCLCGMKRKAPGAQKPKHIKRIVEVVSTAQRSDSPAQAINQGFHKGFIDILSYMPSSPLLFLIIVLSAVIRVGVAEESQLPEFGLGTVLVWKIEGTEYEKSFVARIASFRPDRFFEWENDAGQGTVFMPERAVTDAKGYEISSLYANGRDKRTKNETALWLSRRVFSELKEKKTARWDLNGVASKLSLIGEGSVSVEVNRNITELHVIRAADDRKAEWSFLNLPENPLMVMYEVRNYRQSLASITIGAADSLRWIKGDKLPIGNTD